MDYASKTQSTSRIGLSLPNVLPDFLKSPHYRELEEQPGQSTIEGQTMEHFDDAVIRVL